MSNEIPPVPESPRKRVRKTVFAAAAVLIVAGLVAGLVYTTQKIRELHAELMETAAAVETQFDDALSILNTDPLTGKSAPDGNSDPNQWESLDINELFKMDPGDPGRDLGSLQEYLDQLLGMVEPNPQLPAPNTPRGLANAQPQPKPDLPVALGETPNAYVVIADMPGVEESGIQVSVEDDTLMIIGRRSKSRGVKAKYLLEERDLGDYERTLTLLGPADETELEARYENGVLTVIIPKDKSNAPAKPVQKARS